MYVPNTPTSSPAAHPIARLPPGWNEATKNVSSYSVHMTNVNGCCASAVFLDRCSRDIRRMGTDTVDFAVNRVKVFATGCRFAGRPARCWQVPDPVLRGRLLAVLGSSSALADFLIARLDEWRRLVGAGGFPRSGTRRR